MGRLTAARVRTARHSGRTKAHERLSDGDTLFLQLAPTGAKCWVQVVQVKGRRYTVGLGGHRFVTLAEAREAAFENRKAARRGIAPVTKTGRKAAVPTFEEATNEIRQVGAKLKAARRQAALHSVSESPSANAPSPTAKKRTAT